MIDVSLAEFEALVLQRSFEVPVVVDFWAAWCGPCKVLGPLIERLEGEYGGSWELAKVDVDANQQLAAAYGVQGIPAVIAFRDGEPIDRFTGALPEAQIRTFLDGLAPSTLDLAVAEAEDLIDDGDAVEGERILRAVIEAAPTHEGAAIALAGLLLETDRSGEALEALASLPRTEAVRRVEAVIRLSGTDVSAVDDDSPAGRLARGRRLAAASEFDAALELLIEVVAGRTDPESEEARRTVLDLFEVLGGDHPLTTTHRRRLASALF